LDSSSDDEEDGNDEENDVSAAGDNTNEQITVPITDQDQRGANAGLNLALGLEEEVKGTLECPPGFTLNSNGQCERIVTQDPECPVEASTFNPETDKCESTLDPSCPLDPDPAPPLIIFVYNTVIDKCVSNTIPPDIVDPACENAKIGGELNTEIDKCVLSREPICEVGTFNPETDRCEQRQTQPPT
jgi:hypothetical protein